MTPLWGNAVLVCGQCGLHVVAERGSAPELDQQQGRCDLRVEHVLLAELLVEQHDVQVVDGELHDVRHVDGEPE